MPKRKENKEIDQVKKQSRAKYQCLPELAELIRQVNLVPIGIELPDFEIEMKTLVRNQEQSKKKGYRDLLLSLNAFSFLFERIKHLPQGFLDFLKTPATTNNFYLDLRINELEILNEDKMYPEFISRYVEYYNMRNSILKIIDKLQGERDFFERVEKLGRGNPHLKKINRFTQVLDEIPISITNTLKRDSEGMLQLTGLAALIGKFDANRLRVCKVCERRIFWANRDSKKTCSPDCFNALRQRRHRERNKEEINKNRRKNYYYKNKIEFCKECVYPLTKYNCGLHCNFS